MTLAHLGLVLLVNLVWGFNFVAAKVGVGQVPPLLLTALRFTLVLALLSPFLRLKKAWSRDMVLVAFLAGALHFGLIFTGTKLANASITAILVQLQLPFATILSMLLLKEKVGWRRWAGIVLAFGGVMILGFDPHVFEVWPGALLTAAAAMSMATAQIVMRRMQGVGVFELQSRIALVSAPALFLASLALEQGQGAAIAHASPLVWGIVAYTAIGASILGHGAQFFLLQRYDVSLVAPLVVPAPIFGVVFGVLLLGEPMSARILIGGAIALAGVAIIAIRQGRAAAPSAAAEMAVPVSVEEARPAQAKGAE